jgi:hypothetical protein
MLFKIVSFWFIPWEELAYFSIDISRFSSYNLITLSFYTLINNFEPPLLIYLINANI